jgi:CheY-like chemotaxis protein
VRQEKGMARILLVEDNEMNRDMLSRRLVRRGFEVIIAVDGKQGLGMADTASPDLILLDLSLPEMDGWEVLHHLKQDPKLKQVPVIALTAHALVTDRDRALKAGFDDYDIKPVELPRLLKKMDALLNERTPA